VAGVFSWGKPTEGTTPSIGLETTSSVADVNPVLADLLMAQASVLEGAAKDQGLKLKQAELLMAEAVEGFGGSLRKLDSLAREQYGLSMELRTVLEVKLDGEDGTQSVEQFTATILGTLDLFVQAMLEIGQSSFQLVEEMDGIRATSESMVSSLGELAEVAQRTQMLALNASIEAAHARQYGAGFSVVAGEVQKLADRSGRISDQLALQVRETEAALNRTNTQVEIIASKDLNEIIRSKQLAQRMVSSISQSELRAQQLVVQMEAIGRDVKDQVARSIQALQFEDMVRQILLRVTQGSEHLSTFALRTRSLAEAVASGTQPLEALLVQATRDFLVFAQDEHDSVKAASMQSGDVELF